MVIATWTATSSAELDLIGGWVHDAPFEWTRIEFDRRDASVTVPFCQEAPTAVGPGPELVARRRRSRIYKVPMVRCAATVLSAQACTIGNREREDPGMLDVITAPREGEIVVAAVVGPETRIAVRAIDVRIEMTDQVELHLHRRTEPGGSEMDRLWNDAMDP